MWSSFAVHKERSGVVSSLQAAQAVALHLGRLFDASLFFTVKETKTNLFMRDLTDTNTLHQSATSKLLT